MTALLLCSCIVFVLALVHASTVTTWRAAFARLLEGRTTRPGAPANDVHVTVIVPARNAARTIAATLQDLYAQGHPRDRVEVLVIDDHSEDGTAAIAASMALRWQQLRVITLTDARGKKAAISEGVRSAKHDLLLISDADVRSGPDRLASLVNYWSANGVDLLLLPVWTRGEGLLGALQEEEQFAFLGAAAGSAGNGAPLLANGANMAFTKAAFASVGGYLGDRQASGDDLFLLQRMRNAGKRIGFLLDRRAVVEVEAEVTWRDFFSQRLRWSGKMSAIGGQGMLAGLGAVFLPWCLILLSLVALNVLTLGHGLVRTWSLIAAAWLLWLLPAILQIRDVKRFLGLRPSTTRSVIALLMFPFYALPVALLSLVVRPHWKGRRI